MSVRDAFRLSVVTLSCALAVPAAGDVIIGNLGAEIRFASDLGDPAHWAAQSFTTDANAYRLGAVTLMAGDATPGTAVFVSLHADGPGLEIGAAILGFVVGDMTGPAGPVVCTPEADFDLQPGTDYWIVVGVMGPGAAYWSYAEDQDPPVFDGPGSVRSDNAFADSADAGATWTYHDLVPGFGSGAYIFQVEGTPITGACGPADVNADGVLDFFDVQLFLNWFSAGDARADFAADGVFDFFDVQAYLNLFAGGCP